MLAQCLDFYERQIYTLEQALMVAVVILADQLENIEKLLEDQMGSTSSPQHGAQKPSTNPVGAAYAPCCGALA